MTNKPRLMDRAEAAAYCGYSPGQFSRLVTSGRLPPALRGLRRWDRAAIDAWLDQASGIDRSLAKTPKQVSDDAFDAWEREYEARHGGERK